MGNLIKEDFEYLLSRGYTEQLLLEEVLLSLGPGEHSLEGAVFYTSDPVIVFTAYSMSGDTSGIQTVCREKHQYRWYQAPGKAYLPILYGSNSDFDKLYLSKELILVEGIFDRIAIKRMLPDWAVFARLSKGVSGQLAVLLRRYAKKVWTCFDNDQAGKKGTEKTVERIGEEVECLSLDICTKDPSDLLIKYGVVRGAEMLRRQMEMKEL